MYLGGHSIPLTLIQLCICIEHWKGPAEPYFTKEREAKISTPSTSLMTQVHISVDLFYIHVMVSIMQEKFTSVLLR